MVKRDAAKLTTLFSIACVLLYVPAFVCTAQILYTDIDPDTTLCTSPAGGFIYHYYADLNKDGKIDFHFTHYYAAAQVKCYDNGASGNDTCNVLVNDHGLGVACAYHEEIGPNSPASWRNTLSQGGMAIYLSNVTDSSLPWHAAMDKYLGVSIKINNNTHYGWIRMDIDPATEWMRIKDFAIDMTPNRPILAGDNGTVSVDHPRAAMNDFRMYARGKSLIVEAIGDAGALRKGEIAVYNLLGSKVASKPMESRYESISMQRFPAGSYLVTVRTGEQVQTALLRVY